MKENNKKLAFISGEDFYINGNHYTRLYTKKEIKDLQANKTTMSKEREQGLEKRMKTSLKKTTLLFLKRYIIMIKEKGLKYERVKSKGLTFISGQKFLINGKVFVKPYTHIDSKVSDTEVLEKLETSIEKNKRRVF